ncbi:uncharacterized protein LOC111470651 [Cucurbita maxima]|uniref:Uncharacterized protein LOC111470651 n=1 Tax=Cucurbita maxima TaxID=3661 RepID=A0A6J1I3G6_CUCMA|nr:uncharacterized protein LOC111470651 [Cucurbita maxima]
MSSNSGHFWSFTILRFRSLLLQLSHKINTSAPAGGCRRRPVSEPPQSSSVAVVPYSFRSFGLSSLLRSYCPRAKWIFGSLLSLFVPSWNKWQALEDEAEKGIEEAEHVAEVVEKVAELTEKVSAEIGEKLPEKSRMKDAAEAVEKYSKEIAHDALLAQHILHKVEEWKQKLDKSEADINEQMKKIVNK